MLELFGSGYVIEHCISAFYKEQETRLFRMYMTDAIKILTENTAGATREGKMLTVRYAELIDRTPPDTRTPEEVIGHFKAKLRKT